QTRSSPHLFPYTTLFRSSAARKVHGHRPRRLTAPAARAAGAENRGNRGFHAAQWRLGVCRIALRSPHPSAKLQQLEACSAAAVRSEEHTSELQSLRHLVC